MYGLIFKNFDSRSGKNFEGHILSQYTVMYLVMLCPTACPKRFFQYKNIFVQDKLMFSTTKKIIGKKIVLNQKEDMIEKGAIPYMMSNFFTYFITNLRYTIEYS